MLKNKILLLFLLVLFQSCFIKVLEHRAVDDGTSGLSSSEKQQITPFHLQNFNKKLSESKAGPYQFETINRDELFSICEKNKFTLVNIWASWCSKCYASLGRLPLIRDSLKMSNCELVLISQNVNISAMGEYLRKFKYPVLSYIIDSEEYGTNETQKQIKFCKEIAPNSSRGFSGAVPLHLLFNTNKECIFIKTGRISIAEIDSVIKMN